MGLRTYLEKIIPDIGDVIQRFPIPALVSVATWIYYMAARPDFSPFNDDGRPLITGLAAFLAAGAASLFAEGRNWPPLRNSLLSLAVALIAGSIAWFRESLHTAPPYLISGLILVLMISPHLRRHVEQGAIWLFNLRLGMATLLAIIVGLLFSTGLSAIAETLRFLFDVKMPAHMHEYIWKTGIMLVGPLYGLALIPKDIDEPVQLTAKKGDLLESGVSVLVNYVLAPLVIVYTLILHAYAIKIALQWKLPDGEIGTIASIFALGGTGAWLIAWPWRDSGSRLLRFFMKYWFLLTIVPAILLVIAIVRRIGDYGVTVDRYGLALIAAWLVMLAPYLGFRRSHADIRAILGSCALLLLIGATGPWGANNTSIASQFARLERLLQDNGVLKDGRLVSPVPSLTSETAAAGETMVYALQEAGGLDRLKPWFVGVGKDPFAQTEDWQVPNAVLEALNLSTLSVLNYRSYNANAAGAVDVMAHSRLVGPLRFPAAAGGKPPAVTMEVMEGALILREGDKAWHIPLADLLAAVSVPGQLLADGGPPLVIKSGGITLAFESLGMKPRDPPELVTANFWIVVPE